MPGNSQFLHKYIYWLKIVKKLVLIDVLIKIFQFFLMIPVFLLILSENLGKNNGCNFGYLSQHWKNCLSKMYYKANFFNIWHTYTVNENSYFFVQNLHLNQIRTGLMARFFYECVLWS